MSGGIDFAALAEPIARHLFGRPNPKLSTKKELRFGTHGSLSVEIAGEHRGQFYDHEAGTGGGVLDMIQHKTGLANGAAIEWLQEHGFVEAQPAEAKSRIVATYRYESADRTLMFEVVRFAPKTFRQRRPDGHGGWVWNLQGVDRILYRLPELLAADPAECVFVAEGEKDVDNLRALGVAATCNPGGASKPGAVGKRLPAFSAHMRGRDVVILPDADEAGDAHAQDVAAKLAGVARSIRILPLPGLPAKGDVSDWIGAGGTAADLRALAGRAPLYGEPQPYDGCSDQPDEDVAPPTDLLGLWDAGEDDYVIPPRGWLLGNAFCRRFLSSLVADGGVGKTAVRIAQLIALATGISLTGEHIFRRCRVLIVSLEDDRDELRRRVYAVLRKHGIAPQDVRGWLFLSAPKGIKLAEMRDGAPQAGALEKSLRDTITARGIDVVSLDPFVKLHTMEENSNSAIDYVCGLLTKIAIECDCAVDVPHHSAKGIATAGDANRSRGASSMKDAARLVFTLTPMSSEEAAQFGVSDGERRSLIRLDSGKVNIAPSSREATWFRLVGVPLGNATEEYPNGDEVQTIEPWMPPDIWGGFTPLLLNQILDDIETGLPGGVRYSPVRRQDVDRAAWRAVQKHVQDRTPEQCQSVIGAWLKTGLLVSRDYEDPTQRRARKGLFVDATKRPGNAY